MRLGRDGRPKDEGLIGGRSWTPDDVRPAARILTGSAAGRYRATSAKLARTLWWIAALSCVYASGFESAWLMSVSAMIVALGFVAHDLSRGVRRGLSVITVFSFSAAIVGFANAVGLLAQNTPRRAEYFLYAADDQVFLASLLALAVTVLPVLGFYAIERRSGWRAFFDLFPRVRGGISEPTLTRGAVAASLAVVVLRFVLPSPPLGTVGGLIYSVPVMAVFVLARRGAERNEASAIRWALLIAAAASARALLFGYLRAEIAEPFAAFAFGAILGRGSLAVLRSRHFWPVYIAAAMFVAYFGALAAARPVAFGVDRIAYISDLGEAPPLAVPSARPPQTVLGRMSTFNQLSQVGRVVQEDGFLHGETLQYLGFVFIPRFLWPDKPKVAEGAWFALRIGQAYMDPLGRINNSVNMTIPGELYLNFGWPGVVIGCFLFGGFLAFLWSRLDFWDSSNVLGSAFGYYILWIWVGLSLGADLQVIVTLIAEYLLFVLAGWALRSFHGGGRAARRPLVNATSRN